MSILEILQYGNCAEQTFSTWAASFRALSMLGTDLLILLIPSSGVRLVLRADLYLDFQKIV